MQRINELLKPGGIFISATACLRERRSILSILMVLLTKIGTVPTMRFFKISKLEDIIEKGDFRIVETKFIQSARLFYSGKEDIDQIFLEKYKQVDSNS